MNDAANPGRFQIADAKSYVRIRYRVRIENGPVLKGAAQPEEMDFITGYSQVIPGLERRLIGHLVGEKLAFTIPPEEAFGLRHKDLIIEKSRNDFHFPGGMLPHPGMELPLVSSVEGAPETVIVREIKGDTIVIDCNHPLSGASLHYDLEIVEARPATEKDICTEWEETAQSEGCGDGPHALILGATDPEKLSRA